MDRFLSIPKIANLWNINGETISGFESLHAIKYIPFISYSIYIKYKSISTIRDSHNENSYIFMNAKRKLNNWNHINFKNDYVYIP